MSKRILLTHPHSLLRRGLRLIFSEKFAITDMDEVSTTVQMTFRLHSKQYTHLIVGFSPEDKSVAQKLEMTRSLFPDLKILFLSDKNLDNAHSSLTKWRIFYHIPLTTSEEYALEELQRFLCDDMLTKGNRN